MKGLVSKETVDIVSVSWGVKFKNWVLSAEFTQNNFISYPQGALHLACSRAAWIGACSRLQNCKAIVRSKVMRETRGCHFSRRRPLSQIVRVLK